MRRIRSSGSVKAIWLDRDQALRSLATAANRLKSACPEVEEVLLMGSLARGDHTGTSDADILLVLRESRLDPSNRIRRYLAFFDLPIGVDLVPLTREELNEKRGGSRWDSMLGESILLA